jgi:hypothetical protein
MGIIITRSFSGEGSTCRFSFLAFVFRFVSGVYWAVLFSLAGWPRVSVLGPGIWICRTRDHTTRQSGTLV